MIVLAQLLMSGQGELGEQGGVGGEIEKRGKTTVDYIMKGKVKNSEDEVRKVRQKFERKYQYLQRRWGHYVDIMATFNTIMQAEVTREWEDGKLRSRRKNEHLERKWGKKTKRKHMGENGEWRGIKFGDEALEEVVAKDNKPLKYGGVVRSPEEDAVLSLPSGFTNTNNVPPSHLIFPEKKRNNTIKSGRDVTLLSLLEPIKHFLPSHTPLSNCRK